MQILKNQQAWRGQYRILRTCVILVSSVHKRAGEPFKQAALGLTTLFCCWQRRVRYQPGQFVRRG